jgi:hypothetical protein
MRRLNGHQRAPLEKAGLNSHNIALALKATFWHQRIVQRYVDIQPENM